MKKQLFDLTIEEFVWVLFNMQKPYIVEWKTFPRSNGDEIEMRGTYTQIHDILMDVWAKNPKNEYAQKLIKQFEDKFFDYDMELSPLDIYNYLDEKTKGFDHERCKAILNQMEVCRFMEINEEMQEEIYRRLGKGMIRLKHVKIFDKILKKEEEVIDYKDAYRQIYGYAYDFAYYEAIGILESKIAPELVRNKECCGRELQNAQHSRYLYIAGMLKDANNDNVVNDIVEYVRHEIENNGKLIGGKGFIDYVLERLHNGTELDIWASGSKWLDEKRTGNVFERLESLRLEQFEADKERPLLKQKQAASKPQHKIAIPEQTEPSTERAKKYFQKAVESGYMEKTTTGYKWIRNCRGKKAQLSYFLMKVYNPDNSQQIPFKALEALFDVTRLDSSYSAMLTVSKPQIWRQQIDNLFEE